MIWLATLLLGLIPMLIFVSKKDKARQDKKARQNKANYNLTKGVYYE